MAFPAALPSYTTADPNKTLDEDNHTQRHNSMQDDIINIATKVGTDASADTSSLDYKTANVISGLATHIADVANPHAVTKTQVGLGNVDNTSDATKNSATATLTNKTISASDNTITDLSAANVTNRTRSQVFQLRADGVGGIVDGNNEGPDYAFTGTPTSYVRGWTILPKDWASGTDAAVKLIMRSTGSNTPENTVHYVGVHKAGDTFSSWNEQSNVAGAVSGLSTNSIIEHTVYTIPGANLEAGDYIVFAFRISSAISGTIYVVAGHLEYTADS